MKKNKKRNVSEEVKNGIKDLEAKLTEIENTMKIDSKEIQEKMEEVNSEEKKEDNKEESLENTMEIKLEDLKEEEEEKPEKIVVPEEEEKPKIEETIKYDKVLREKGPEVDGGIVRIPPNKKENKVKEKKPKNYNNTIIILSCLLAALVLYVLPTVFIFAMASHFDNMESRYQIIDNMIVVGKGDTKVRDINGYFDEENQAYIVYGYVENKKNDYLEIDFDLYDSDDFIIGRSSEIIYMKEDGKYKFKAVYDGVDAREVVKYEFARIYCD